MRLAALVTSMLCAAGPFVGWQGGKASAFDGASPRQASEAASDAVAPFNLHVPEALLQAPPLASQRATTVATTDHPNDRVVTIERASDGAYEVVRASGTREASTLDAALQDKLVADLVAGRPQWGATVVLDLSTGAVLAMAEHSERERDAPVGAVALMPIARAASVFKVITTSALLRAEVPLSTPVCTSGGKTRMSRTSYMDDAGRDHRCMTFADVLPHSQNVALAKLSVKHLTPELLRQEAARFGIQRTGDDALFSVELPTHKSHAAIADDDIFAFAEAASGFGDVRLSAFAGAQLAAIVGGHGELVPPTVLARVADTARPAQPVLEADIAQTLLMLMRKTVTEGTASRAFSASRGRYGQLRPVDYAVAGKTGSLTDRDVHLDTTWFVGTGPVEAPRYAIATMIVNDEWLWEVRALDVARRAFDHTFARYPQAPALTVAAAR